MSDKTVEGIIEILLDHANAEEAAAVNLKHRIVELVGLKGAIVVSEETFSVLSYEKQTGNKIGAFEVAGKTNNLPDKFQRAYNILVKNNATIADRYHGDAYIFGYWIYGDRIYRQLKKK